MIFNQVASDRHEELLRDAADAAGIPVLGMLRRRDQLTVPSRHLGLIPAAELGRPAAEAVAALAGLVAASVDLEAVIRLARTAGPLRESQSQNSESPERKRHPLPRPRIAIAGGPAFTFGYAEHPELLAAAGADVVSFDPLRDEGLPGDVDGLVIGGGFPEEHAAALSANERMRAQVAALARAGAPVMAECAGLLYLARSLDGHPMCGVLDAGAVMTGGLTLGYRDAVAAATSPLATAGTRVHGHEFHRTAVQAPATAASAWHWRQSGASVTEGFVQGQVHASYLHTHWDGIPGAAAQHHRRLRYRRGRDVMTKRLIGVGVGPGDPELVTVKAVRVLREADVVLVPVLAARLAKTRGLRNPPRIWGIWTLWGIWVLRDLWGQDGPRRSSAPTSARTGFKRLEFALNDTGGVTPRRAAAWQAAAAAVANEFAAGAATIAFGTLGDPNLYSTFSYLAQTVRDLVPEVTVETVAGITAMQDLASRAGISLAEGTEPVTLVPLNGGADALDQALACGGTVVGYKVGAAASPAPAVLRDRLHAAGRLDGAIIGARLGLEGEFIALAAEILAPAAPATEAPAQPAEAPAQPAKAPAQPAEAPPHPSGTFRTFRICLP